MVAAATAITPTRPTSAGCGARIIAQIVRLHRRKRFHKQRFVQAHAPVAALHRGAAERCRILNAQREIMCSTAWRRGC